MSRAQSIKVRLVAEKKYMTRMMMQPHLTSETLVVLPLRGSPAREGDRQNDRHLEGVGALEVLACLHETNLELHLGGTDPDAGVIVFFVWLVLAIRVAALRLQVILLLGGIVVHALPIRPLGIRVNVHLDDAKAQGGVNLALERARSAVEDEQRGLVVGQAVLLLDVGLVLAKPFRRELDVAGLVRTVHISCK
jgi:hypothetical protein